MNRIQQNSYAKSLGLTRDQLARIAYQRALDLNMTHEQAAAAANVNAENMKSITVQKNFQKALEKVAEVFTPLLEKIGNFLSTPYIGKFTIGLLILVKTVTSLVSLFKTARAGVLALTAATQQNTAANLVNAQSQTTAGGAAAAASSTRGLTSAISTINMTRVLQGAAALAIVAGSLYIFGKAVQQFKEVGLDDIGTSVAGMLALVGATVAVGAIMMSQYGAVAILAGAAAMTIMGGAVMVLGSGVQTLADGFNSMIPNLMGLTKMIPELYQVADALDSIGNGLIKIATAGILAIPALMVVSSLSETQATEKDAFEKLERKIERLIQVVEAGGDVYLDGNKVGTARVLGTFKSN